MFVPRRVLYELRAGREYFGSKERCVFCDIIQQEERQAQRVIESRGDYLALGRTRPAFPMKPGFCREITNLLSSVLASISPACA